MHTLVATLARGSDNLYLWLLFSVSLASSLMKKLSLIVHVAPYRRCPRTSR